MTIVEENFFGESQHTKSNQINANLDCTDLRFYHSLLEYATTYFKYVEKILLQSGGHLQQEIKSHLQMSFLGSAQKQPDQVEETCNPWVSQKYVCTKILIKMAQLFMVELRSEHISQLFMNCMKVIQELLKPDSDTEDKASGLNILAALCGLTN